MAIQIKLKNSVVQDSTPSTSDLPAVGEIALNANINSIGGFMRASDNTIVKIFGPGSLSTPTATTTVSGISELATNSETTTGTATNRVVTPAGLNAVTVAERTTSNTNYVAKAGSTLTGVLTMPNGSNSAPAINFGDSDSGIFGGTNTVSLTAGGTTRLTADTGVDVTGTLTVNGAITSTDDLTIPDKIIHSGDANTSIRFPASDTISFETSATEKFRVDSGGHISIGTSTSRSIGGAVERKLQIEATDGSAGISITRNGNANTPAFLSFGKQRSGAVGGNTIVQDNDQLGQIHFAGADGTDIASIAANISAFVDGTPGSNDMPGRLEFKTTADGAASPTTRLTIDSAGTSTFAGNVDCSAGLDVTGATTGTTSGTDVGLTITQNGTGNILNLYDGGNLVFKVNSVGNPTVTSTNPVYASTNSSSSVTTTLFSNSSGQGVLQTNSGSDLIFGTGAVEKVRITSSGNVGIGTTSPNSRLNLKLSSRGSSGFRITDSDTTNDVLRAGSQADGDGFFQLRTVAGSGTVLFDSSGVSYLTGGNVGIGTSSPSKALEVVNNTTPQFQVGMANDSDRASLMHNGSDLFLDTTAGGLIFRGASNAERMRLDSDGRVLAGTSSARTIFKMGASGNGQTPTFQFETANNDDNNSLSLTYGRNNAFGAEIFIAKHRGASVGGTTIVQGGDRLGALTFAGSDGTNFQPAACIEAEIDATPGTDDMPGRLLFSTTADGAIVPTERMRITSTGNVGIGTANPTSLLTLNHATAPFIRLNDSDTTKVGIGADGGLSYVFAQDNNPLVFTTSTGTAFTERMRLDSSGQLLKGCTTARAQFFHSVVKPVVQIEGNGDFDRQMSITSSSATSNFGAVLILARQRSGTVGGNTIVQAGDSVGLLTFQANDGTNFIEGARIATNIESGVGGNDMPAYLSFFTNAGSTSLSERMRITSGGNVGIGTTSPSRVLDVTNTGRTSVTPAFFHADGGDNVTVMGIRSDRASGSIGGNMIEFFNSSGTKVGSIQSNGSTTSYNPSSDYRLKENAVPISDGITRLKTLKPYRFNWKADPTTVVDGFFAHEVTAVPEAISGTKDQIATADDANDMLKEGDPMYQGLDQSKLVPLLVAALQELIGRVETLEAA